VILHTYGSLPYGAGTYLGGTATLPLGIASYRVSDDADFLAGLCDIVTIMFDARSGGTSVGRMGGVGPPNWQTVDGLDAVACRRGKQQVMPTEGAARPGDMASLRWLFGRELHVERGYLLVHLDPEYGRREYPVLGKTIAKVYEGGQPHHWQVYTQDRAL
jgi:hypothetical protein